MTVALLVAAPPSARAFCDQSEGQVIAPNGGFFLETMDDCVYQVRAGERRIPLRRVDGDGGPLRSMDLYRPARPLARGTYHIVSNDSWHAEPGDDFARIGSPSFATAVPDDTPPIWSRPPEVDWLRQEDGCLGKTQGVLRTELVDRSAVRVTVDLRWAGDPSLLLRVRARPLRDHVFIDWPAGAIEPGVGYEVTLCAEDGAGHTACAPAPVAFVGPACLAPSPPIGWECSQTRYLRWQASLPRGAERAHMARPLGHAPDWPLIRSIAVPALLALAGLSALLLARARHRQLARHARHA